MPFSVGCKYGSFFLGARLRLFTAPPSVHACNEHCLCWGFGRGRAEKQHPLCLFPLGVPAPAHVAHLPLCSGSPVCPICAPAQPACMQAASLSGRSCMPSSLRLCPTQSVGCYATLLASWHARGGHGGHLHIISDMRMTISDTRFPLSFLSSLFPFKFI